MPRIYIDGRPIDAEAGQTVKEAAVAHGIEIPAFCWHPKLSVSGSCRVCAVQVEGRSWVEISCNMPVAEDLKVLTDTDLVRAYRKSILELTTLNHPVDCGICDKSGECTLQDYHYEHNGAPSTSRDVKVHATKFHKLSGRITLDNERCILCSRCVRFTHEVSKSKSLGIVNRGDHSLVRASEDGAFAHDAYSDNVVDICPVGALLATSFLYKSRVWYLQPTPSVCPGCARGCAIELWHRKPEWKFNLSPLFLEYLMGKRHYPCTPWGMPTYNLFGWQKPCYLLQDGYTDTFEELMRTTEWSHYGTESGNPKCANCMVHSGYEASAVHDTFNTLRGFLSTVKATLFSRYRDSDAFDDLNQPSAPVNAPAGLVQLQVKKEAREEATV